MFGSRRCTRSRCRRQPEASRQWPISQFVSKFLHHVADFFNFRQTNRFEVIPKANGRFVVELSHHFLARIVENIAIFWVEKVHPSLPARFCPGTFPRLDLQNVNIAKIYPSLTAHWLHSLPNIWVARGKLLTPLVLSLPSFSGGKILWDQHVEICTLEVCVCTVENCT